MRRLWNGLLGIGLFLCVARFSAAADPIKKVAFLVGVSEYEKAGLRNLRYAEEDMKDLAKELSGAGFQVRTMLGSSTGKQRATSEQLRQELSKDFVESLKKLNRADLVLIAFAGHGIQRVVTKGTKQVEDVFFCPVDCVVNANDTNSFLSISDLMDEIANNSGSENNLFVIDACRDNPSRGRGIDGSRVNSLPSNMACLFGASSGTQSYESEQLKHGLLTYYLLEGLRGRAKDEDDEVTWNSLVNYSMKQVTKNAKSLVQENQVPNFVSNIKGSPPVLARIQKQDLAISNNRPPVVKETITGTPFAKLIDPTRDALEGEWTWENNRLVSPVLAYAQLKIPVKAPAEYRLTLDLARSQGDGPLVIGLMTGNTGCLVSLDNDATRHTCDISNSQSSVAQGTGPTGGISKKKSQIVCTVRNKEITVMWDGKEALRYHGEFTGLSVPKPWALKEPALFIGSKLTSFEIIDLHVDDLTKK